MLAQPTRCTHSLSPFLFILSGAYPKQIPSLVCVINKTKTNSVAPGTIATRQVDDEESHKHCDYTLLYNLTVVGDSDYSIMSKHDVHHLPM